MVFIFIGAIAGGILGFVIGAFLTGGGGGGLGFDSLAAGMSALIFGIIGVVVGIVSGLYLSFQKRKLQSQRVDWFSFCLGPALFLLLALIVFCYRNLIFNF